MHPFSYEYELELAEKLDESMRARMNASLSAQTLAMRPCRKKPKIAADLLHSEFHITDGKFRLGGQINRSGRVETLPSMSHSHLEEEKAGKSPETYFKREVLEQETSGRQRQAKHVASITPTPQKKKQLIL